MPLFENKFSVPQPELVVDNVLNQLLYAKDVVWICYYSVLENKMKLILITSPARLSSNDQFRKGSTFVEVRIAGF